MSNKVAIVGGGFTGLACANVLRKSQIKVKIFEKNASLGGLASGFREPGWKWSLETYYHHWFESDSSLLSLAGEVGLKSKLVFKRPVTVMETRKGTFLPLDSAAALLQFSDISFLNRFRMGFALAYLKATHNWRALESVTAEEWCCRAMGKQGYEGVWEPLLTGKFGEHAARVNMAWLWARIKTRTPRLGTFEGGFQAFVDAIGEFLEKHGVEISLSEDELCIEKHGEKWKVFSRAGEEEFDAVLVAASPAALEKTYPPVDAEYISRLKSKPSLGAQVVIISSKTPLQSQSNAYWYSLRKQNGKPFLAIVDHSKFVDAKNFDGEHLFYIADYVSTQSEDWKRSDSELVDLAIERLQSIDTTFEKSRVFRHWVFREAYAQPVPYLNASQVLPHFKVDGAQGLFHASLAHVYPWDRGTNFAIQLGENVGREIEHTLRCGNKI